LAFVLKDKIFEYFVQHGTFDGAGNPRINLKRKKQDLIIEIICLIIIGLPSIYFLMKFLFFASLFSQIIFLFIVLAGNFLLPLYTSESMHCSSYLGTFGVRLMIQTSSRPKQE
jgi:hypothetical protein